MSDAPKLSYFLVVQKAIGDPGRVHPVMEAHMAWLKEQLAAERLVLTGTGQTEASPAPDAGFIIAAPTTSRRPRRWPRTTRSSARASAPTSSSASTP